MGACWAWTLWPGGHGPCGLLGMGPVASSCALHPACLPPSRCWFHTLLACLLPSRCWFHTWLPQCAAGLGGGGLPRPQRLPAPRRQCHAPGRAGGSTRPSWPCSVCDCLSVSGALFACIRVSVLRVGGQLLPAHALVDLPALCCPHHAAMLSCIMQLMLSCIFQLALSCIFQLVLTHPPPAGHAPLSARNPFLVCILCVYILYLMYPQLVMPPPTLPHPLLPSTSNY